MLNFSFPVVCYISGYITNTRQCATTAISLTTLYSVYQCTAVKCKYIHVNVQRQRFCAHHAVLSIWMHHSKVQVYDSYSLELTVSNASTACVQPRAGSFLKTLLLIYINVSPFNACPVFHVSAIVLGVDGRDTFIIFTQCVHRFRAKARPPTPGEIAMFC